MVDGGKQSKTCSRPTGVPFYPFEMVVLDKLLFLYVSSISIAELPISSRQIDGSISIPIRTTMVMVIGIGMTKR